MTLLFLLLGLGAGAITTIAGQGGGMLLLLACAALVGPHAALAITSPALLFGNLHRAVLLRRSIDRAVARRMIAGAVPGAIVGGVLAGVIPSWGLRAILVAMAALAVAKAVGLLRFAVPRGALGPAGAVVGVVTGTGGGAGILFAPVLLSAGLGGRAFIATSAAIAFATHVGRVAGYAGLGLFSRDLVGPTIAVTLAIFAGNAAGDRLRAAMVVALGDRSDRGATILEHAMLVLCVVLSVAGLG